ncbi:MAG: CoA pyrophosphatase [Cyclobacteriaceae bacterium]
MTLTHLVDRLNNRLKDELPGESSHIKMNAQAVTGQRFIFKNPHEARKGAVLILLYEINREVHFVLTQRPDYNGAHGGQISFPGGKHEEEDPDLFATALREAEEEVGVSRKLVNVVGSLSEYFVGASNHLVLPVVGYTERKPLFVPDDHEVAEILPVPLRDLLDDTRRKSTILEVGENRFRLNAPYFDLHGKVVWGATAGMLSEFKDIVSEIVL